MSPSLPFPFFSSLLLLVSVLILYCLRPLFSIILARFSSPLRLLPSPPSPSLFLGNLAQLADQENNDVIHAWTKQYGQTFAYRGFFNCHRLLTTDPTALSYILGHAYDFPKPGFITDALAEMGAGHDGLLTAQGDIHKRQVCLSWYCIAIRSHSDLPSAESWYRFYAAYTVPSDAMPITPEPSIFSFSHQVYHPYLSRKGRTRMIAL